MPAVDAITRRLRRDAASPLWVGGSLLAAAGLVVAELMAAAAFGLPALPFAVCALLLLGAILLAAAAPSGRSEAAGRVVLVAALLKVFAVGVAYTGGLTSPYHGALFLPIFLGALYFGLTGGAATGVAVTLFVVGNTLWGAQGGQPVPVPTLLSECGVFLLVSVAAGAFSEHLRRTASIAGRRARQQAERASQAEWFIDTAVMMQSLPDLEYMLSAALLRLERLTPCDSAAVFLRDPDGTQMLLAQTMGMDASRVTLRRIPLEGHGRLRGGEFSAVYVADALPADPDLGELADLDPTARSVVIVPLRTLEDLSGVLFVASRRPGGLTERDRDNIVEFARHIVYPIQRVRLQALATTDALTGLHNHRAFRERLRGEVERSQRYRHPLSLILIDIDHFKRVNDTLGHPAGDAILTQCGGILRRVTRGIDYPVRYGGEELAILCPETSLEDARALAERVRATVAATEFALPAGSGGGTARVTVSAGVAELDWTTDTESTLIDRADGALYRAKADGRDRVRVAGPEESRAPAAGAAK